MSERKRVWVWPVVSVGVMIAAVVTSLHSGWVVTVLWILALPLLAAFWLALVVVAVTAVWRTTRGGRRWPQVVTGVAAVVSIGVPVMFYLWPQARVWARFQLERPAFDAAVARDLSVRDYYGTDLPTHLCWVSANCKVAVVRTADDHTARFVPDYVGIPDGAVGYAHLDGEPPAEPFEVFGDQLCPVIELGDGWWWLGQCG
ncbi:hypothetical protein [Nocardia sp. GTS18]|uniref:hypothetical protein n=1 Tax=Nocardia sp. GTS18 TaxID=1778064 RepID=UPI0015EE9382|nr:hypothetical protein [Nocardia sp. GTS18]